MVGLLGVLLGLLLVHDLLVGLVAGEPLLLLVLELCVVPGRLCVLHGPLVVDLDVLLPPVEVLQLPGRVDARLGSLLGR
jgi:hypothetical protein